MKCMSCNRLAVSSHAHELLDTCFAIVNSLWPCSHHNCGAQCFRKLATYMYTHPSFDLSLHQLSSLCKPHKQTRFFKGVNVRHACMRSTSAKAQVAGEAPCTAAGIAKIMKSMSSAKCAPIRYVTREVFVQIERVSTKHANTWHAGDARTCHFLL